MSQKEEKLRYRGGESLQNFKIFKAVEIFGDYWHGPEITGKSRAEHKKEVLDFYKKCRVECLVLWENEVNKHPKRAQDRLKEFLGLE